MCPLLSGCFSLEKEDPKMTRLSILCVAAVCVGLFTAWVANAHEPNACCQPVPACQPACEQPAPPACEPACQPVQRVGLLARLRAHCEARRAAKACCEPAPCEAPKPCEPVKVEPACQPECPPPVHHHCRLFRRHHRVVIVDEACCQPAAEAQPAQPAEAPKPAPQPEEKK